MKIICYLFSVYLILLTGVTCADRASHLQGTQTEIAADMGKDTAEHGHELPGDNCSPFCGCQCCHLNVFLSTADVDFSRSFLPLFFTGYNSDIPETAIIGLFKPPKFPA